MDSVESCGWSKETMNFFSNSLKLPHWASKSPCWECSAKKDAKPANMCYKTLEKGKQAWKRISNEEALANPKSAHNLFSGVIPGLSTKMVRGDCLHILFTKGVLGHLLGSCIHYFLYYDGVEKNPEGVSRKKDWVQSLKLCRKNMLHRRHLPGSPTCA